MIANKTAAHGHISMKNDIVKETEIDRKKEIECKFSTTK